MDEHTSHRVVVGVDGSTGSHEAVEFAAREASARNLSLHLVCAFLNPATLAPPIVAAYPLGLPELNAPDPHVSDMLAGLAEDLRSRHSRLEVVDHPISGSPSAVLVDESRRADLLVVGARGHGGFGELLAGSTATQVATHAHCPVIVVRGASTPDGPVVAGVEASPKAELVLDFAFQEADWHDRPLRVIHCWTAQIDESAFRATVRQRAELELAEALAGWAEKYPHITVEDTLVEADATTALVEASSTASLVVVGSRGRGALLSLLLGSTSYALAHHAHCPVAVIRTAT